MDPMTELLAKLVNDHGVTGATGGKVWVYRPDEYRARGKRYGARERLRRRRFYGRVPETFTSERV